MSIYFRETQHFRKWWRWVLIAAAAFYGLVWLGSRFFVSRLTGDVPHFRTGPLIVWSVLGLVMLLVLFFFTLHTKVTEREICVKFIPFHWSPVRIPIDEIKFLEVVAYSPKSEYGGYGIRTGLRGKAYHASGNKGVRLIYGPENTRILIGSQKSRKLADAIRKAQQHLLQGQPQSMQQRAGA